MQDFRNGVIHELCKQRSKLVQDEGSPSSSKLPYVKHIQLFMPWST